MKEYIFVHMIDKRVVGDNLGQSIPLHLTMLPWFKLDIDQDLFIEKSRNIIKGLCEVATTATNEAMFGPNNNVPVMRVKNTNKLLGVHLSLVELVSEFKGEIMSDWVGETSWNPHVTHKAHKRLESGDSLIIDDIDLILREDESKDRIIVSRFGLNQNR